MSDPVMPPVMPMPARQGLVARVQAILLKPAETWDVIAAEPDDIPAIFTGYVVPLATIGPVCGVLAALVFDHIHVLWAIIAAIVGYVLSLGMVFLMAFIVYALAPVFGGPKNAPGAFKLVAFAGTPSYMAGVFWLLPALAGKAAFVGFIYAIYLFFLGEPRLIKTPTDKRGIYAIVVVICDLVIGTLIGCVVGAIMMVGVAGPLAANTVTLDKGGHPALGEMKIGVGHAAVANGIAPPVAAHAAEAPAKPLRIADAHAMLALMPPSFNGATRADTTVSSGAVAGMAASTAEATYTVGGGSIHLKLADMGAMAGVGAMANALNVNSTTSSDGGYETIKTDGNRITTEHYDTAEKTGEYDLVLDGRVAVSAEGHHVDMATLKTLVGQIDIDKVDALTH